MRAKLSVDIDLQTFFCRFSSTSQVSKEEVVYPHRVSMDHMLRWLLSTLRIHLEGASTATSKARHWMIYCVMCQTQAQRITVAIEV